MKDKNNSSNGNAKKMLSIGIDSKVKKLCIKCYYEQIIRYFGSDRERGIIEDYAKTLKEISDNINNCIVAEDKESLLIKRDEIIKDKNTTLKRIVIDSGYLTRFIDNCKSLDSSLVECYGILHDKDVFWDDFFTSRVESDHIHVILRGRRFSKSVNRRAFRVGDLLDSIGIKFDKEFDKTLLDNHAVEVCNNFEQFVKYLTHETKESEVDGKFPYSRDEVFYNVSEKEYQEIIESYDKLDKRTITKEDIISLMYPFREYGKKFVPFADALIRTCSPYVCDYIKSTPTYLNSLYRAYNEGVEDSINERIKIDRICIYIYGKTEIGKTSAVEYLCSKIGYVGKDIYVVRQGSGKYDGLNAGHKVMFCDDCSLHEILNVADERAVAVHRRGSDDRPWVGELLIVTSNKSPKEFFHEDDSDESDKGRMSRFAIVHAEDDGKLILEKPIMRGSRTEKVFEKKKKVLDILSVMEESTTYYCSMYQSSEKDVLTFNNREENVSVIENYRNVVMQPFEDIEKYCLLKAYKNENIYIKCLRKLMSAYDLSYKDACNILLLDALIYKNDIIRDSLKHSKEIECYQTSFEDVFGKITNI